MNEPYRNLALERRSRIPLIVGHRGSPRRSTENTVGSVRRAMLEGAAAVELDLCRTRDGRLVLWHDDRPNGRAALARQAGLVALHSVPEVPRIVSSHRRAIDRLSLAEMRESHGYHRKRGIVSEVLGLRRGRRIPFETLEDLLSAAPRIPGLQHIYLDLRLQASLAPEAFRLAARLAHFGARDGGGLTFHIMSPEVEVVRALQQAAREAGNIVAYADLPSGGALKVARRLRARNVALSSDVRAWGVFREELLRVLDARDRGQLDRVAVWTVNDPRWLQDLLGLGPDAVLTDDIPLALRLLHPVLRAAGATEAATVMGQAAGVMTTG